MLEIYRARGLRELLDRSVQQIPYQTRERLFGSRAWFSLRMAANGLQHEIVENPYKISNIDPHDIKYRSARYIQEDRSRWHDLGLIVDGQWDMKSKSSEYAIENELLYRAIEAHFKRDVPWKQTEYVKQSLERLRQDEHEDTWRAIVQSEEDLWERCEQLDELYDRIKTHGYKSKREVFESQSTDPMGYYPRTFKYTIDEVMIDRGRHGEPLLVDGQHRLFIAKVCGVKEIPVLVAVRHQDYIEST